jgi:flagellar assembly protein FliH
LSRIIKSPKINSPNESLQLDILSIHRGLDRNLQQSDSEISITDKMVIQKKDELTLLESEISNLQAQLGQFEGLIQNKQATLRHLDQEIEVQTEELKQQAFQSGYEDGYKEGISEASKQYEETLESARKIVETTEVEKIKRIEASEETIIDLSIGIAKKIVSDTLQANGDAWFKLVRDAINEVKEKGEIKLFVHPNQFYLTNEFRADFEAHSQMVVSVYPDGNLKENQCLIDTKNGLIDASIDTQLEVLREKLIEVIKGEID